MSLLATAVEKTDFTIVPLTADSVVIDASRAMIKNRWGASITGTVTPSSKGTDIQWSIHGPGDKHYKHLSTIAEGLPEGSLYGHGIPEAASKVMLRIFGRRKICHPANMMDHQEKAHAIGVGALDGKMGIVALTGHRLIFLEKGFISEDLVEFSLASIRRNSNAYQRCATRASCPKRNSRHRRRSHSPGCSNLAQQKTPCWPLMQTTGAHAVIV